MTGTRPSFLDGLGASLPIVMGYFPIAFSFGVAATRAGFTEIEASALSLIIYAGASQFLALALLSSGAPVLVAAFTLIAMNLRHLLYGPALMRQAGEEATNRHAWAWAWGLTDEVFGQALGALARGQKYMFGLGLGAYASWVSGTVVGAFAGGGALEGWPALNAGLGFMLPALFLALLLSILSRKQVPVIAVAAAATVAGTLAISATSGILLGMLAGALTGVSRK